MYDNAYTCAPLSNTRTFPSSSIKNSSRKGDVREVASFSGMEFIEDGLGKVSVGNDTSSIPTLETLTTGASSLEKKKHKNSEKAESAPHTQKSHNVLYSQGPLQPRKQNENFLSWRSDPSASFSDWTIEVVTTEDDHITCSSFFHCHSNVLVWGPRKSNVFVKLFQERMRRMPHSSITQIELSEAEAEAFPLLLDFIYCETTLSLSADQICNLYLLAEKFENTMLMDGIQSIVEKALSFEQSIEFLSCARHHRQRDKLEKLVLCTNSKICGYLVEYPKEARKVPPETLAHILHRRAQVMKVLKGENPRKFSGQWESERSRLLSTVVAECCYHAVTQDTRASLLTRHTFDRLVNPKHLPALDSQAALKLLQVDGVLQKKKERGDHLVVTSPDRNSLSSFESRCIRALVSGWRTIINDNQASIMTDVLSSVNGHVLAEILVLVSKQYERQIGTQSGTPRGHDILQKLHSNESKTRIRNVVQREMTEDVSREVSTEDSSIVSLKSTPDWDDGTGSSGTKDIQRYEYPDDFDEGTILYPANRYTVDNRERLVFK